MSDQVFSIPRDLKRIPNILIRLERVWNQHPDMRLAQLLENAGFDDLFYVEDEDLISALEDEFGN